MGVGGCVYNYGWVGGCGCEIECECGCVLNVLEPCVLACVFMCSLCGDIRVYSNNLGRTHTSKKHLCMRWQIAQVPTSHLRNTIIYVCSLLLFYMCVIFIRSNGDRKRLASV